MRQVPRYMIIGDGRMATHFCYYLTQMGVPHSQYSRRQCPDFFNDQKIVVLLSDAGITEFIEKYYTPYLKNKIIIHFSGQLYFNEPNIYGAHPLMTFGQDLYDVEFYTKINFIMENTKNKLYFTDLFPELPNTSYPIPPELKAYYHALCVLSGNFTCIVWQKFFHELQNRFGIPREAGFLYLKQITQNILTNPDAALTGPLSRGDHKTIEKNIEALEKENDKFKLIYEEFVKLYE